MSSMNGDGPNNIPSDTEYSDDLMLFQCSRDEKHLRECDGSCESFHPTETQIDLLNELKAWARIGMVPAGIPAAMRGIPFRGLLVEIWDLELRMGVLMDVVKMAGLINEDDLDEKFRETKLRRMQTLREENEVEMRKQRVADNLGIVKKPIFGPHGEPIG